MSEKIDYFPLVKAMAARGGFKKSGDPQLGVFETVRQVSIMTDQIFPQQLNSLKINAMLVSESTKVVLSVDPSTHSVKLSYTVEGNPSKIRSLKDVKRMMTVVTKNILGPSWEFDCDRIENSEPGTAPEGESPAKPKRARGSKPGHRKSRK